MIFYNNLYNVFVNELVTGGLAHGMAPISKNQMLAASESLMGMKNRPLAATRKKKVLISHNKPL